MVCLCAAEGQPGCPSSAADQPVAVDARCRPVFTASAQFAEERAVEVA